MSKSIDLIRIFEIFNSFNTYPSAESLLRENIEKYRIKYYSATCYIGEKLPDSHYFVMEKIVAYGGIEKFCDDLIKYFVDGDEKY